MIQYTNKELCKRCGGKCCKISGCLYAPEDFEEITFNSLVDLYKNNKISFLYVGPWAGVHQKAWILTTPQVDSDKIIYNLIESVGKKCAFLTETGCSLDYHKRPRGGKKLIPLEINGEISCESQYGIEEAADDWIIYEGIIKAVIDYLLSLERQNKTEFIYDHELCKLCGGSCCKATGCYFSPKDFRRLSYDVLKRILDKGYISIILMYKEITGLEKDVYTLRMRNKGGEMVIRDHSKDKGGLCIIWEKTGCPFNDEDRPYGGKALIPDWDSTRLCQTGYSHRQCAEDWLPYQDILKQLAEEFVEKNIQYEGI